MRPLAQNTRGASVAGLAVTLLTCLLAACAGIRLPAGLPNDLFERTSGLIAYVGADGNIHTVDQSGTRDTAITGDADLSPESGAPIRFYEFPTWTPSGDGLAFIGGTLGPSNHRTNAVYTAVLRGGRVTPVFQSETQAPIYLYWAPDGRHLSFLITGAEGAPLSLQIVSADGNDSFVLDAGQPYYWAWSPAESRILAHVGGAARTNPQGAHLSLLAADAASPEMRLDLSPSFFQAPAYSPAGDFALFAAQTDDDRQALMLASPDGQVRTVLVLVQWAVTFDWEPGGEHVAYVVTDDPAHNPLGRLSFVNVKDPDRPETIVTGANDVVGFFWSPTGGRLAYFAPVVAQDSGQDASTRPQQARLLLAIRVIDVATGAIEEVARFRPTQPFLSILPFYDQYQRSASIWSPDGERLVYSAVEGDGSTTIYVVPATGGGAARAVAKGVLAFWSPGAP